MLRLKLPNFEGPLDLLLYLIRKNKLDIKTISLARITTEYLEYIRMFRELDLNVAGEYIVMATTLIKIKVRALLPYQKLTEQEEIEDEANILVKKLKEYEKFKNIALFLREKEKKGLRCFPGGVLSDKKITIKNFNFLTYQELENIFSEILTRTRIKPVYSLSITGFNIKKRMQYILERIMKRKSVFFNELIEKKEIDEIIVTFVAVLELVKIQKIKLIQKKRFGRMKLYGTSPKVVSN